MNLVILLTPSQQFGMPGLFVLVGVILVKLGNNSIFGEVMRPVQLSTDVFNPKVTTHRDPIPFNDYGPFYWSIQTGQSQWTPGWSDNVTGQYELMNNIPNAADLPVYAVDAPSGYNMSMYLLFSRNDFEASRYGAFTFKNISDEGGLYMFTTHANFTGAHAPAIYSNVMANAVMKRLSAGKTIKVTLNPLLPTKQMVSTTLVCLPLLGNDPPS